MPEFKLELSGEHGNGQFFFNALFFHSLAGLERGLAGEPAEFTIVTKDAGPGGLALAVHGPSKAEITCQDNGDGSCSVSYVPEEPGKINWLHD